MICGKSFPETREEITLGYLEGPHVRGETYTNGVARRRAFRTEMKAGSFILVPWGVSQAAACDGIFDQVISDDNQRNPGPGVLPI